MAGVTPGVAGKPDLGATFALEASRRCLSSASVPQPFSARRLRRCPPRMSRHDGAAILAERDVLAPALHMHRRTAARRLKLDAPAERPGLPPCGAQPAGR